MAEESALAPTLFDDELDAVIEMLKNQPMLGAEYQMRGGEMVRRVWGARRGRGPKL